MTYRSLEQRPGSPPMRFWNTLAFRVALVVNLAVIGVLGTIAVFDYRRERATHVRQEIERLREEAKVLAVARAHTSDRDAFQRFLDDFCRQMSSTTSPEHHIVVLSGEGEALMRAHEHASPGLEAKMATTDHAEPNSFMYEGEKYLSVSVGTEDGSTIVVTQSLAPIESIIRVQWTSRLISLGLVVVLISGVTTIGLVVWVRRPLQELVSGVAAVERGWFGVQLRVTGSAELRYLGHRINEMAHSLEKVKARRQTEMKRARAIQQGLLPIRGELLAGYDIAASFIPTDAVGGDLYDILKLPDGSTLLVVMDVSGHGVAAALCTALLRTVLRHQASVTSSLARIAEMMSCELGSITDHGGFATCFYARIDCSGIVDYLSAGHDPAIIVRSDGGRDALAGNGLPLGVEGESSYQHKQAYLNPGDRLFLFTDGLHEVFDDVGRPLGRKRLEKLLVDTRTLPPEEQLRVVIQSVRAFQAKTRFGDDVTLLCTRRK